MFNIHGQPVYSDNPYKTNRSKYSFTHKTSKDKDKFLIKTCNINNKINLFRKIYRRYFLQNFGIQYLFTKNSKKILIFVRKIFYTFTQI